MKRREFLRALVRLVPAAVCGGVAVDAVRERPPSSAVYTADLIAAIERRRAERWQEIMDAYDDRFWQPPAPTMVEWRYNFQCTGRRKNFILTQGDRT